MNTRYKKLLDFTSLLTFCIKIKSFVVRYAGNSGQGIMLNTASHELVHFIRQWSPEKYKILADFLMEQYGEKDVSVDKLVNMQIEKAKALGRKISYEEAHEEVIADSMETMLNDGKVIEKLQMLQAKDKTLFEKIRDYLTDLINRIKKAYKDVRPETTEGEIIAGMLDKAEEIQQLFTDAIADASENFKGAEVTETKNTAEAVKFSIKEMGFEEFDKQTLNNIKMRKGVVLNSISELKSHIERALQNPQEKVNCYLGVISTSVKSKIEEDVGQKLFEENKPYTFVISYDDIQHISEHFNSVDKMVSEVLKVYEIIKDYDSVEFEIGKSNAKKLIFDKSYSNYDYRTVEIVSKSKSSLDLVTFFITKNNIKGSQSVPPATRGSLQRGSASNNRVPQNGTDVNTSISENDMKYSDRDYLKVVESGDMKTAQRMVDEAAKVAGYTYKLYHQTGNDFTVFDTRHQGAGTGDSETPFGVFMKPTSNNIGLRGQKQMPVFAKIEKPLIAADRDSLTYELKKDETVKNIQDKVKTTNDNYKQKVEQAGKDLQSYLVEYRKSHPDEPRSEIYNDEGFNEIYNREDSLIEEWTAEIDKLSIDSKNAINEYLKNNGYDGVIIERDVGSFGRETKTYIALDNTQVKSAEPVTYDDNGNIIPLSKRFDNEQSDIRYSERNYSYDALVSKPDMKVTTLYNFDQHDRKDVVKEAKKNATSVGKANSDGSVSVYVNDIDREVIVSTKSIRHSLDSRSKVNIPVVLKIGEILKNSIKINELNPREENISQSYVLMGMAKNPNNEPYIVSFVVNSYTNTIDTVDVLYSANAKTEPAGSLSPRVSTPSTDSKISISDLLDYVNRYFSDILPEDVLRHYGHVSRPDGKLGESALFSDRDPNALTPRNLLANALESSAVHEVEKKKLAEYKDNIEKLYAKEQELYEVRKKIKELSFSPGKRDTAKLKKLRNKAIGLF